MNITFRSKVDRKLALLGLAMPLTLIGAALGLPRPFSILTMWPMALLVVATVLISWIFLSTYYEFESDSLIVHAGPFSWPVPLDSIEAVRPTRSIRSGPALSLDRIEITYERGRVILISPANQEGFLQLLCRRIPQLQRSSSAWVRVQE